MFLLLVSAAAVLQQAPPDLPNLTDLKTLPPPGCRVQLPVPTAQNGPLLGRKLGDLPPGRLFHAVMRSYRGCEIAEVRGIGPDGQAAWVWEPSGPGQLDRALPTGSRITRHDGH